MNKNLASAVLFLAISLLSLRANDLVSSSGAAKDPQRAAIQARLHSILLDRITVYSGPLRPKLIKNYLDYMTKRSKELDPAHIGVTFRLDILPTELEDGAQKHPGPIHLMAEGWENIPLSDFLDYLCQTADLTYKIQKGEVVVSKVPKKSSAP